MTLGILVKHCLTTNYLRIPCKILHVKGYDTWIFIVIINFLLDDFHVSLITLNRSFMYALLIQHYFGICLTCAESWNLTLSDILLVVSINGSGVLLSPQQNPTIAFFTNLWWTINYIIPFFFFWSLRKIEKKNISHIFWLLWACSSCMLI